MAALDGKNNITDSVNDIYILTVNKLKSYNTADLGILLFILYIFAHRWFVYYLRSGLLQLVFIIVLLLLILFSSNTKKTKIVEISKIDLFWFLGFGVILIYITLAGFTNYTQDIFIYSAGLAFIFITKVDIKKFRLAFSLILAASVIYALGTIAQYLFTDSFNQIIYNFTTPMTQIRIENVTERGYFPGLGFGRTGLAAGYIAAGLGLVSFNWELKSKKQKIIEAAIFIILMAGLILTGKRSAILWVAAALPIVYISLGTGKEKLKRLIMMSVLMILIVVLFILLFQVLDSVAPLSRIELVYRSIEAGDGIGGVREVSGRLRLFGAAWEIFLANPVFGIGWNQFIRATSGLLRSDYMTHNIYLQLLSEMGIIGFTAVIASILYSYVITYKSVNIIMMYADIHNSLWAKGLSFSLYYQTFFILMGLSESVFYTLTLTLIYFFSIAITNAYMIFTGNIYTKVDINQLFERKS